MLQARDHQRPYVCRRGDSQPGRFGAVRNGWLLRNSLIAGAAALLWLLLRSGPKPSRLSYPCQQAAFSTASLAFGVPLVAFLVAVRRRLATSLRVTVLAVLAGIALLITISVSVQLSAAKSGTPALSGPGHRAAARLPRPGLPRDAVPAGPGG